MNFLITDSEKQTTGVVDTESFISIESSEDFINRKVLFTLKVRYSEVNWRSLRDAVTLVDDEIPGFPITVDTVKVVDADIVVKGHVSYGEVISTENQENVIVKRGDAMKYYFITFMYGASEKVLENDVIDKHPLTWQKECNNQYPGQYVLTDWKELTKEEYVELFGK